MQKLLLILLILMIAGPIAAKTNNINGRASWIRTVRNRPSSYHDCPEDKPLTTWQAHSTKRNCLSCDILRSVRDPDCQLVCPNRILLSEGYCALRECPKDAPMREPETGSCFPCDKTDITFLLEKPDDCEKVCPNRTLWKSDSKYYNNNCVLKECPQETIRSQDGRCLPCKAYKEDFALPSNAQECEKCDLISWKHPTGDVYCAPQKCPGDLREEDGQCSCDNHYSFTVDDPQKCSICGFEIDKLNSTEGNWKCERKRGEENLLLR